MRPQLNIVRNVIPVVTSRCNTIIELSDITHAFFLEHKLAYPGQPVVLTASHPVVPDGSGSTPTNFLKAMSL